MQVHSYGYYHNANFAGQSFVGLRLKAVTFSECNLAQADFEGAVLENCTFVGCSLYGVVFDGSTIYDSVFEKCPMIESSFVNTSMLYGGFFKSNLAFAHLDHAEFLDLEISESSLYKTQVNESVFGNCEFSGTVPKLTHMTGATFDCCVFWDESSITSATI